MNSTKKLIVFPLLLILFNVNYFAQSNEEVKKWDKIQSKLLKTKDAEKNIKLLENFLEEYPGHFYEKDAKSKLAEIEFTLLKNEDAAEPFQNFIAKYPDSPLVPSAQEKIAEIGFAKIAAKKEIELFEQFIKDFPNTKSSMKAEKRMSHILEYRKAMNLNSIEACQEFMQKYPESDFILAAKKKIKKISLSNKSLDGLIAFFNKNNISGEYNGTFRRGDKKLPPRYDPYPESPNFSGGCPWDELGFLESKDYRLAVIKDNTEMCIGLLTGMLVKSAENNRGWKPWPNMLFSFLKTKFEYKFDRNEDGEVKLDTYIQWPYYIPGYTSIIIEVVGEVENAYSKVHDKYLEWMDFLGLQRLFTQFPVVLDANRSPFLICILAKDRQTALHLESLINEWTDQF